VALASSPRSAWAENLPITGYLSQQIAPLTPDILALEDRGFDAGAFVGLDPSGLYSSELH
jgi:hypothetical protein